MKSDIRKWICKVFMITYRANLKSLSLFQTTSFIEQSGEKSEQEKEQCKYCFKTIVVFHLFLQDKDNYFSPFEEPHDH